MGSKEALSTNTRPVIHRRYYASLSASDKYEPGKLAVAEGRILLKAQGLGPALAKTVCGVYQGVNDSRFAD